MAGATHVVGGKNGSATACEIAKDAAEQAGKTVNEAAQRVREQVQPTLDQGEAVVEDLANRASETGRQAVNRAGEFIEGAAHRPSKWRAISTSRVLSQESTYAKLSRNNPSQRC